VKVALITALIYKNQRFDLDLIQYSFDSTIFEHVQYDADA